MAALSGLWSLLAAPEPVQKVSLAASAVIAAAGFEDRSLALPSIAFADEHTSLCVVRYKDWDASNREAELLQTYECSGVTATNITKIEYDRRSPDVFADSLADWLKLQAKEKLVVDISAMSRLCILMCLEIARTLDYPTELFYAEPKMYGPSQEEYEQARSEGMPRPSIQIYSGVDDVVRSKRLSSVALQGEPSIAIMFMSMNDLLTQALLNQLYPSRLFLINGRPPVHQWREEATAWIHNPLLREWPVEDNPCELNERGVLMPSRVTSTFDYRETADLLLSLYWRWSSRYRIILAPTGSKLQTLGAFFVRAAHDDIHVEYPTPKGFLPSYTTGIGSSHLIRCGVLETTVNALRTLSLQVNLLVEQSPEES